MTEKFMHRPYIAVVSTIVALAHANQYDLKMIEATIHSQDRYKRVQVKLNENENVIEFSVNIHGMKYDESLRLVADVMHEAMQCAQEQYEEFLLEDERLHTKQEATNV